MSDPIDIDDAADAAILCLADGHGHLDWWARRLTRIAVGDPDVLGDDVAWRNHLRHRLESRAHAFAGLLVCELCGHTDLHPIHRDRGREHTPVIVYGPDGETVCRECLRLVPVVAEAVFFMDEPEPADPLG